MGQKEGKEYSKQEMHYKTFSKDKRQDRCCEYEKPRKFIWYEEWSGWKD